jgi:tetratricopeptide (TPR) repeat protein
MTDTAVAPSSVAFDAFLSHAHDDEPSFRDDLVAGLQRGGARIWSDRESLANRGLTFDQEIARAIETSARLLLLVGEDALASDYVAQEWGYADDRGIPVIPILRSGTFEALPERLRHYHAVDARAPRAVDAVVADVVRLLKEPVLPLGPCYGVPWPAPHELARADLLERLSAAVAPERKPPEDAARAPRAAVLYGVPGVGKSTVAAVFARAVRTRRAFPDGIVWLACGPSFQPLAGAREVLGRAAVGAQLPRAADEVATALIDGLADKAILLVLDDVRDPDLAAPFVGALGPGGRAVVTTLDQAIATVLGAVEIAVEQLDDASSRQLLEGWTGAFLPPEADAVLAESDGLPLALAIVGAMVTNKVSWAQVAEALAAHRLDLIEARFPGYPHPNVLRALYASYDALKAVDPRAAECYLELAAFRPGAELPEGVMIRLWSRPGRLEPVEAGFVLPALERRLLVVRKPGVDGDRFALHGLQEDFVRLERPNPAELEEALVDTYRSEKGAADWATLPDDGYVYDHLIVHLASLGHHDELMAAVDAGWVHRQLLRRGDLGQALADVRLALSVAAVPPLDLPSVGRLSLLSGQIAAGLGAAPSALAAAMAEVGDVDRALSWAADKPDPDERLEALVGVARALIRRGELTLARRVIRTAVDTIPQTGAVVETGVFSGLTALNAVHALVDFPEPDQWEGTTDELVAAARIPLDAVVRLAPLAVQAGAAADLAAAQHPFWGLYEHLIPLVAVEQVADAGDPVTADALLEACPEDFDFGDDRDDAARYRRAVAAAAVGRFEEARAGAEQLPESYRPVAYRGLARHLAAAGQADEAIELIGLIDDDEVREQATEDVVEATIERAEAESCERVAQFALDLDWAVAAAWLRAAGGDPSFGLRLLDSARRDDLRLGLGVRFGDILRRRGHDAEATDIAQRLVPAAERLLGPQWFALETVDADPQLAALGLNLLSLRVRVGEPIPDDARPLAVLVEGQYGHLASFALPLVVDLVLAGRFVEAVGFVDAGPLSYGRALGLATALSVADSSTPIVERRRAVESLVEVLDEAPATPYLDAALAAVVHTQVDDLGEETAGLLERLLPRTPLWSGVGAWALARAEAGEAREVRALVRRLLVERPLPVADEWARAGALSALATRRPPSDEELEAAAAPLRDLATAARALDVVFEVVSLYDRERGFDAAGSFAQSVPEGPAAAFLEDLLRPGEARAEGNVSWDEVAAAAAVRAVAAAAMALAAVGRGSALDAQAWLERAEAIVARAAEVASHVDIATPVHKYLGATRVATGQASADDDGLQTLAIAWFLWENGHTSAAARSAREWLERVPDPLSPDALSPGPGGQRIFSVEDFNRMIAVFAAARAALSAVLAVDAADRGDAAEAKAAAAAAAEADPYGWASLTLAERAEIDACVAIALQRAGEREAARGRLAEAVEPALTLARRGELGPFWRLCQALLEVLPPERAGEIWADWLIAAAGVGANEALMLISSYVPWLAEADLTDVTVDPWTGQLQTRSRGAGSQPSFSDGETG